MVRTLASHAGNRGSTPLGTTILNLMMITLTTDFGLQDPYVAQMKGVILSLNPTVTIVDVTHEIPPQSVMQASFALGISFFYFPTGTVHVAVVDPGVGTQRRGIIISALGHLFVGPDNGIFSFVLERAKGNYRAVHISHIPPIPHPQSSTFHGRDVFAPVSAILAMGTEITEFGPEIGDVNLTPLGKPVREGNTIRGNVIYIDRFGNAITNISQEDIPGPFTVQYAVRKKKKIKLAPFYQGAEGELACLFNSAGFLELFSPMGHAAEMFGIKYGDLVRVILSPRTDLSMPCA